MVGMLSTFCHRIPWVSKRIHFQRVPDVIFTTLFRNNHGSCMLNKPDQDYLLNLRDEELLAGEKFEANEQCQLVFGSGSTVCSYMVVYLRSVCCCGSISFLVHFFSPNASDFGVVMTPKDVERSICRGRMVRLVAWTVPRVVGVSVVNACTGIRALWPKLMVAGIAGARTVPVVERAEVVYAFECVTAIIHRQQMVESIVLVNVFNIFRVTLKTVGQIYWISGRNSALASIDCRSALMDMVIPIM